MKIINWIVCFILLLPAITCGQKLHRPLQLSNQAKKQIIEFVFKDGLPRIEKKSRTSDDSPLQNCAVQENDKEQLLIISTDLLKIDFVPEIKGYQYEFKSPDKIKSEYEKNNRICYFEIGQFDVLKNVIRISLGKSTRKLGYIYQEGIFYQFTKKRGRWIKKSAEPYMFES